ncbi:MAG TPA: hypothetical protein VHR16_10730, partial [Candidatus Limnocylindrales bacterium]|nr:hypothetical protein [Candidatus Limnocylindrales bacterium]
MTAFGRRWAPRLLAPLLSLSLIGSIAPAAMAAPMPAIAPPVGGAASGVATAVTTSAIEPGSVNRTSLKLSATYSVSASLAVDTGVLRVSTTIIARNDSGAGIDRVELNTVATRLGAISITSAAVDGHATSVTVSDQTLLVPLGGVLPAGATVRVHVAYRATLRNSLTGSNWLFTRYGGTISMYRWIPWVSAARPFDRPNHGDPFVTPSSPQVDVTLTLDKARILAAPIAKLSKTASKSWAFSVQNVRD